MAQTAVDEAVRNIVVHGANPEMICLLDNFCWPDPVESEKTPDGQYKLGQLVRASKGLYDVCKAYGMPLVSGKDSMKNDFKGKSRSGKKLQVSILPTLLVTSMGAITPSKSITPEMKNSGDDLYLLGKTQFGMAGSTVLEHTSSIDKAWDKKLSDVTLSDNITLYKKLHEAIQMGVVESAHDVGEGGLLVSLAEKCIGSNGLGIDIDLGDDSVNALVRAFNENPGQIVVSVKPANREDFLSTIPAGLVKCIGKVTDSDKLEVYSGATKHCEVAKADLKNAWKCSF
jgi:phosphoribosylformylglycinamidine synthase